MKTQQGRALLEQLEARFQQNMHRHRGMAWGDVQARLASHADALRSLLAMEATGGEPDVIGEATEPGALLFVDCVAESPAGRRSCCYDAQARLSRKENRPEHSAVEMAAAMGVELLSEDRYRALQQLGEFDTKTSSWIQTPSDVRALGGALFCDRRYGRVFTYHNGVQSYYASRGFRASLQL